MLTVLCELPATVHRVDERRTTGGRLGAACDTAGGVLIGTSGGGSIGTSGGSVGSAAVFLPVPLQSGHVTNTVPSPSFPVPLHSGQASAEGVGDGLGEGAGAAATVTTA